MNESPWEPPNNPKKLRIPLTITYDIHSKLQRLKCLGRIEKWDKFNNENGQKIIAADAAGHVWHLKTC